MTCWPASWVIERLLPNSPVVLQAKRRRAQQARYTTKREMLGLLQNHAAVARLLEKPVRCGVADILGTVGVAKHPSRAFYNTVLACSYKWGSVGTLLVAVDVLLGDANNPAAVLKHRLKQEMPVQKRRQSTTLQDMIQQLRRCHDRTSRTSSLSSPEQASAQAANQGGATHHRERVRPLRDSEPLRRRQGPNPNL